ncbi:MAG: exosortase-associated EpsI family protein [Verrucomicrobiota bacterium]|nr:exosortase-associated EpsI family protein [Verrucomicrobiota bacterium]
MKNNTDPKEEKSEIQNSQTTKTPANKKKEMIGYIIVIVILLGTVAAVNLMGEVKTSDLLSVKLPLPSFVGTWLGQPVPVSDMEKNILPSDTIISKSVYRNPGGFEIFATALIGGREGRSIHRPEYCLPGQGWTIVSSEVVTLDSKAAAEPIKVTKLLLERTDKLPDGREIKRKLINLYWFEGNFRKTPHHWQRVLWSTTDKLFDRINHRWAFLTFFSEVTGINHAQGLNEAQTVELMDGFIGQMRGMIEVPDDTQTKP